MKEVYDAKEVRTIGLVGHNTTGKTSLAEALFHIMGESTRIGNVTDGNTASDYHSDEIERQCSIYSACLVGEFDKNKINVVDAPGFSDFVAAIKSTFRISDVAINVMNAVNGVDFGSEMALEYAEEYQIPTLFLFNMLDRDNIDYDGALEGLTEAVGEKVLPLQFPVKTGPDCGAIVDLIKNKLLRFATDGSGTYKEEDIPADLQDKAAEMRQSFIEKVAESDDQLIEKFFEDKMTPEDVTNGLVKALKERLVYPVFCASSTKNVGPIRLLEFVNSYVPAAVDSGQKIAAKNDDEEDIEFSIDSEAPITLFVFKTSQEQAGEMSYFKVFGGSLKSGEDLVNSKSGETERFSQIYIMNGKNRVKVPELHAGDIGAVPRLKHTRTGDTLCKGKQKTTINPVVLPFPSYETAIIPKNRGDEEKMATGLTTIHQQDPSFIYENNPELKQMLVSGQGELHVKTAVERMKQQFKVEIEMEKPKIAYRETIRNKGDAKYRHKKQSGGAGQFAEVWLRVAPRERSEGIEFKESLVGQNVSRNFVPSVEKGCNTAIHNGVISGNLVVDVLIDFYDGKEHPVDSKDIAFQTAGKNAFIEAFKGAKPYLLEPVYNVELKIPDKYMGDIMGDISTRRGRISGVDATGKYQLIKAIIPKAELYQYSASLLSITQGRGSVTYNFSHYEDLPGDLAKGVIDAFEKSRQGGGD